jgi:hypothetical protein
VPINLSAVPSSAAPGARVTVTATLPGQDPHLVRWRYPQDSLSVEPSADGILGDDGFYTSARTRSPHLTFIVEPGAAGPITVTAEARPGTATGGRTRAEAFNLAGAGAGNSGSVTINAIDPEASGGPSPTEVTMRRAFVDKTDSQVLWTLIRQTSNALSFQSYQAFMELVLRGGQSTTKAPLPPSTIFQPQQLPWRLPFPGVDPYRQLKAATEIFVLLNCGVPFDQFAKNPNNLFLSPTQQWSGDQVDVAAELDDESRRYYRTVGGKDIARAWQQLLKEGQAAEENLPSTVQTILYLGLVRANLPDAPIAHLTQAGADVDLSPQAVLELEQGATTCLGILQEKLSNPCFIELLWSYWQEEGALVQTMNAITWRFQNRRGPGDRDPLVSLEIDPLRPLNNFLWGYIQDEQHRLTVVRRAYEYAHQYGLTLLGKAVPAVQGADNRSRFIESLHNLLHQCSIFYKEDDDTTVVADGFPLLNALKEVHLLLTKGASNQYGDLPWTARLEMLMQQFLLARPEFREFLPRRIMVDYPEQWMHSVETMKALQGWSSASVLHFRDLAVFGEQIVLSVRFEAWPSIIESQHAANWARYWRPEIQGYIYAYRAVTSVDLTERVDATAPALLLRQRMREIVPTRRTALTPPRPVVQLPMASDLTDRGERR